jgi:hypothetical protein
MDLNKRNEIREKCMIEQIALNLGHKNFTAGKMV